MAATAAVSPKSLPQSSTGRFEVKTVLARSWRLTRVAFRPNTEAVPIRVENKYAGRGP